MSLCHIVDASSLTPDLDVSFASLKVAGTPILPDQARSTFKITWAGTIDDPAFDRFPLYNASADNVAINSLQTGCFFVAPYDGFIVASSYSKESTTRETLFQFTGSTAGTILVYDMPAGTQFDAPGVSSQAIVAGETIRVRCAGNTGSGLSGQVTANLFFSSRTIIG